jgi:hypothetical protein
MLVVITILITPTLTTAITAAYAEGGDNDNGDGNKQKAEDDSAAAIADCDDNDVELARFLCIALATNDIEIETEPPSEEPAGLAVCKVVEDPSQEVEPGAFTLVVIDSSGSSASVGSPAPPPVCEEERIPVDPEGGGIVPGEYTVIDEPHFTIPNPDRVEVEGDCVQDPTDPLRATGEIQEGETQECIFINIYEGGDG